MAWNLNSIPDKKKGEMYKALANKSYAEVAVEFRIDIHYKNKEGYRNAVYRIAREVEANPEKYGVSKEVVDIVNKSALERKANPGAGKIQEEQDSAVMDFNDVRAVTIGGRNKTAEVIHKKLDMINKSPSELRKVNLSTLGTLFGIMFDKAQILQGQATENIALKAKITQDMDPEESLDELLKMRERRQEEQYS